MIQSFKDFSTLHSLNPVHEDAFGGQHMVEQTHSQKSNTTDVCPKPISICIHEIMRLIPHRYPMLLVDRLEHVVLNERAIGIKSVTMNEWFFQGHFPDRPIMPGVLIVEAMAQTAGILVMKGIALTTENPTVLFTTISEVKFKKPVLPGTTLSFHVQKQKNRGSFWWFSGIAKDDQGDVVAQASYSAVIRPHDVAA